MLNLAPSKDVPLWYQCEHDSTSPVSKFDLIRLKQYMENHLDLIPTKEIQEAYERVLNKRSPKLKRVEKKYSSFATLKSQINVKCPNCKKLVNVLVHVTAVHDYPPILCLDAFDCSHFLLKNNGFSLTKGEKIRNIVEFFIPQWFFLKGQVYIVSPYLNYDDWLRLAHQYSQLEYMKKRPKIIIVTRRWENQRKNGKPVKVQKTKNDLMNIHNRIWEGDGMTLRKGENKFITIKDRNSMKIKKKTILILFPEDFDFFLKNTQIFVSNQYFHAKFYAGVFNENTHVIATSYNFTDFTIRQIEFFSYLECSNNVFYHEFNRLRQHAELTPLRFTIKHVKTPNGKIKSSLSVR